MCVWCWRRLDFYVDVDVDQVAGAVVALGVVDFNDNDHDNDKRKVSYIENGCEQDQVVGVGQRVRLSSPMGSQ